ncbi:hypothetical protein E2C01_018900 [Portunus trituberculatus]|uniref:Uncharacterized protein n=1 Tax=Portunus trituberculatus TaxID=210409 RepID=A0A5B7DWI2_PORTR|nr:hypothetical protein [Portunus trituberculatus]
MIIHAAARELSLKGLDGNKNSGGITVDAGSFQFVRKRIFGCRKSRFSKIKCYGVPREMFAVR